MINASNVGHRGPVPVPALRGARLATRIPSERNLTCERPETRAPEDFTTTTAVLE
jgi:hypothetical protein